jgi:hypothetical protein
MQLDMNKTKNVRSNDRTRKPAGHQEYLVARCTCGNAGSLKRGSNQVCQACNQAWQRPGNRWTWKSRGPTLVLGAWYATGRPLDRQTLQPSEIRGRSWWCSRPAPAADSRMDPAQPCHAWPCPLAGLLMRRDAGPWRRLIACGQGKPCRPIACRWLGMDLEIYPIPNKRQFAAVLNTDVFHGEIQTVDDMRSERENSIKMIRGATRQAGNWDEALVGSSLIIISP